MLFAFVGALVVDDYGVSGDSEHKWRAAAMTISAVLDGDDAIFKHQFRNETNVQTVVLLAMQRLLGLEDSRDIYLFRHMMSHLLFLFAALACAILSYRLTGSRATACVALFLFVLHPRLYAHSFFNNVDIPFLAMFMVSLLLIHRAFARDTVGAFALCGLCVALAFNTRIMGFVLVLAVLAMRTLDWRVAAHRRERKHVLASAGVFFAVMLVTTYATSPHLLSEPMVGMFERFRWMNRQRSTIVLFDGELLRMGDLPRRYVLTWIAQTTPPFTLLLGLAGTVMALRNCLRRSSEALRNTPVRFECLCLMASWGAVAALAAGRWNIYHGWRPLYFLFAPFAMLAAFALGRCLGVIRRRWARLAMGGLGLAGAGCTMMEMIDIHPYQNVYFNAFVNKSPPEYLRRQFEMDYFATSNVEALKHLLERRPDSRIDVTAADGYNLLVTRAIIPAKDRTRLKTALEGTGDYYVTHHAEWNTADFLGPDRPFAPLVYTRQVRNNTLMSVVAVDIAKVEEEIVEKYLKAYQAATAEAPISDGDVRIFLDGRVLSLVHETCSRRTLSAGVRLKLWRDSRQADAPVTSQFDFGAYGILVNGDCWMKIELPWRPSRLATVGRTETQVLWRADVDLVDK